MAKGIRISKKHGVNPSLEQCFVCGEDIGVILFGRLPEDKKAPRQVCLNQEPCDKCKKYMEQGIILISVKDEEPSNNPHRTGGWAVVKEEALLRVINDPKLLEKRMIFVPDSAWAMLGLPK